MAEAVRIQKLLADAGVASRRRSEELVTAGRVAVNGSPAVVGQRVVAGVDAVTVDGRPLPAPPEHVYLALNKPAGVTSTVRDRHAMTTVVDLVPPADRRAAARLYPVGRLDRDSEGLLLLTNDGAWAERVLHPRYGVEREYAVALPLALDAARRRALSEGVELEEGIARLAAPAVEVSADDIRRLAGALDPPPDETLAWYSVRLRQGWKRQLRRMFAALGVPVERLVRVRVGTVELGSLAPGRSRRLGTDEAQALAGTRSAGARPRAR